jgi:ATP-dependent Zn protease
MKRTKRLIWDKIRVATFLIIYAALAEYVQPTPFITSRMGQLIYVLLVLEIFRQLHYVRQEKSARYFKRTSKWTEKFQNRQRRLTEYTRFRIMRIIKLLFLIYAAGWMIDGMTERCSGAFQCSLILPKLLIENLPDLALRLLVVAFSIGQIFLIMIVLARSGTFDQIMPETIKTRFSDVYGQDVAVNRVKENLNILDQPDVIEGRGGFMPGGILLWGPPGTGKTMIAEAFAGETGKPFVMVGPGGFTNMFFGVNILKVKHLFKTLRKLSLRYGGVVCFMDEIDNLGNRGGDVTDTMGTEGEPCDTIIPGVGDEPIPPSDKIIMGNMRGGGSGMGTLEIFLAEMSGLAKPRGLYNKIRRLFGFSPNPPPKYRILFMGATNLPQMLDPALLRPGRFDRKIKVPFPSKAGRYETFKGYLGKVENDVTEEQVETLAAENPRATGASIKDVVNEALIRSVREGRDYVSWEDIRESIIWKSMGDIEGRQPYEEDQWRVALHEAAHAVVAHHYRKHHKIQFASVVRRGQTLGVVSNVPLEERFTSTQSELEANIRVSLASHVAERLYFDNDVSTGPSADLRNATGVAERMVGTFGMSKGMRVANINPLTGQLSVSPRQVDKILKRLYGETEEFVRTHRDQVELVAQLLDAEDTVDGDVIHDLLKRTT